MMKPARHIIFRAFPVILVFVLLCQSATAQRDSAAMYRKRLIGVSVGTAAVYGITLVGLSQLWYKDYPKSSFHFINDNQEWLQMDKCGHAFTSYYEGVIGIEMMKWAGLPRKKAIWIGGLMGTFLQTPIEILDGFSAEWGASAGDLIANTTGSALCISQALLWDEQRIWMKFSYAPSDYARYRPNTLGGTFPEKLIKDYNAQTYWLSVNIRSFLPERSRFPKWLNLAAGYGANGMLGGYSNVWTTSDGQTMDYSYIPRYRQFYLSPDIDLTRLPVKSRFWKGALRVLNCIKFPAPAVEFNTLNQVKWHWIKL